MRTRSNLKIFSIGRFGGQFGGRSVGLLGLLVGAFWVFGFSGCAPKPQTISHDVTVPISGPRGGDVDLRVDGTQAIAPLEWSKEIGADVAFRFVENVFGVRDGLSEEARKAWVQDFLTALPNQPTNLADSAYTKTFIEQAEKMAKSSLAKIMPKLRATSQQVKRILSSLREPIRAGEVLTIDAAAHRLFNYLRSFDAAIQRSSLLKPVISAIHREIGKMLVLEAKVAGAVAPLNSARTINKALDSVAVVAKEFGFAIPPSAHGKIKRARVLATSIESIRDARSALTTLVDVWLYLSPGERLGQFKPASAELYDYLNEMSQEDLQCLRAPNCMSISQWIARTLVIQPKIEEFGIERIKYMLNAKGADAVRDSVAEAVVAEIRTAPQAIAERIEKGVEKEIKPILVLETHFPKALRERFHAWAARSVEKAGPAVDNVRFERARLTVGRNGRVRLKWTGESDDGFTSRAAFDALAPSLWQTAGVESSAARGVLLGEINELARRYQKLVASPIEAPNLSARAYAESVRGLANLALAFREWVPSTFDALLGSIMAKELFPEFKIPELEQSIFPKGAFYAVSFHSLAGILKSVKSDRTQVFLVDTNNRVTRANQEQIPGGVPAVMAGIADRIGNDLGPKVRAEDVARYLIASAEVYLATTGVERSTSDILIQKGPEGKSPRDEIIESREQLKLLILGLANYLSHQFRSGGELVRHELDLASQKPTSSVITVMDQALAIRALTMASEILGNELYFWEAADLVSSMNRQMYRRELGFYGQAGEKTVNPIVLVEMLIALDGVAPHLSEFSRQQVNHIVTPWRRVVTTWKLD